MVNQVGFLRAPDAPRQVFDGRPQMQGGQSRRRLKKAIPRAQSQLMY
jgi:hypothetical protein